MEILVCIKQVPGTADVEVDSVTGVLKRDGVESKLNPYDLFALEMGFELAEKENARVTVITMGPMQAMEVLKEAVYMGAESGVLVSDRCFAGADVCATSYTLCQGIQKAGTFDVILCGKQTTDGDTAQVGPEIAEFMGIPHGANVMDITDIGEDEITIRMNLEHRIQTQRMKMPCLLTVEKDANTPRLPSYKRKLNMSLDCLKTVSLKELSDQDSKHYGLDGSPTQVERIFPPEKKKDKEIVEENGQKLARYLIHILQEKKFL